MKKLYRIFIVFIAAWIFHLHLGGYVIAQAPEQDCLHALSICGDLFTQNKPYSGGGNIDELSFPHNNPCLEANETNSVWYRVHVFRGGSIEFDIIPNQNTDDLDFIVFDLTSASCEDILSGDALSIRCNYSSAKGNTGLMEGYVNSDAGSSGPSYCSPIQAKAGDTYFLMVNNFTSNRTDYEIRFNGTAGIGDETRPQMLFTEVSACNPYGARIHVSKNILCRSIAPDGSDFTIIGPSSVSITHASPGICMPDGTTATIDIRFKDPVRTKGQYLIRLQVGTDGSSLADDCGDISGNEETIMMVSYDSFITSTAIQHPDCHQNDGSITVSNSGGNPPYSYVWNTGSLQTSSTLANLKSGAYRLTITDKAGCREQFNFSLSDKGGPVTKISEKCPDKKGGKLSCLVSGGIQPYQFQWSTSPVQSLPDATGLKAGTYSVSVTDAAGCTGVAIKTLTLPESIGYDALKKNAECGKSNGSIRAIIRGGKAPYLYAWNTNPPQFNAEATNLVAGLYAVTITDAVGCIAIFTEPVNNINGPDVTIDSLHHEACGRNDGSMWVTDSDRLSYEWLTAPWGQGHAATGLSSGIHAVKISDSTGCSTVLSAKINAMTGPMLQVSAIQDASCYASDGMIEV